MDCPHREGIWLCPEQWDDEIEVYRGPNGSLCVWCGDVGAGQYEPVGTDSDEMLGHMMVTMMPGRWTFVRPPND